MEFNKLDQHPNGEQLQNVQNQSAEGQPQVILVSLPSRKETLPSYTPWYNKGWVWMLVVAAGLIVFWVAIGSLGEQASNIQASIDNQTNAIREQSSSIDSIRDSINNLAKAIDDGFNRLITEVREAIQSFG